MTKTVEGVVVSTRQTPYHLDNIGSMIQTAITVESSDGKKVTASKHTKATTKFSVEDGTEVKMTFDETERTNKNGELYVARKVTQLVLLNQQRQESSPSTSETQVSNSSKSIQTGYAAKDLSMEVSGLLQAIITHHGLDGTTGNKLRTALILKRAVAEESREGKLVIQEESKLNKRKPLVEEIVDQNDDDAPFDLEG